jgi:TPR repeat protein
LRERLEHLQALAREHLGDGTPPPATPEEIHSLMVLGYADAMCQLGWRYETGDGAVRNADEAKRYYAKSARLGNDYAKAKLEPPTESPPPPG